MADGLISDGRRPGCYLYQDQYQYESRNHEVSGDRDGDENGGLPPYMPNPQRGSDQEGLEVRRENGREEELRRWGKDREFPGLG
jgi:hypothetical protein